ncbi:MAG: CDP-alcohol phosphatidyltransferase family protein [Thermoplasmatota archaeon]
MKRTDIVSMLSLADSFTIVNGVLGLFAMFLLLSGEMRWAFSFILLAVLADGLDGAVARRVGGSIGVYLDQFADMVSFCAVPLVFAYYAYDVSFTVAVEEVAFLAAAGLFLVCGMLHLVRYHVGKESYFVGITTPAAAIVVVTLSQLSVPVWAVAGAMFAMAVLMVAGLPYPKIRGWMYVPSVGMLFLAVLFDAWEAYLVLLAGMAVYAVAGPIYMLLRGEAL